jgi:hypothetical protein
MEEARDCMTRMLQIESGLSVAKFLARLPCRRVEDVERLGALLHKAGLPES